MRNLTHPKHKGLVPLWHKPFTYGATQRDRTARPTHYECVALPAELGWLNPVFSILYTSLEWSKTYAYGIFLSRWNSVRMSLLPSMRLDGQVVVVTGAGSGIGKAIAIAVAEAGADCAPCERASRFSDLDEVCDGIRAVGREAYPTVLDLPDVASIDAMVASVVGSAGRIDVLVNNAGINLPNDGV